MAITTTHNLSISSLKYGLWSGSSNRGIFDGTRDNDGDVRQLSYQAYTSLYHTSYWQYLADSTYGSLATINSHYIPVSATISLRRMPDRGDHSNVHTAYISVTNTTTLTNDGDVNLALMQECAIQPVSAGQQAYPLSGSSLPDIVQALSEGQYMTLGFATRPTSNSSPASVSEFMGLYAAAATDIVLTITWKPRAAIYIKVNNVWKVATPYIKVDGVWKEATPHIKISEAWKAGVE